MYLVLNKCVTAVKVSNFSGHYLRNRSTLDIGVLGTLSRSLSIPPGTFCIPDDVLIKFDSPDDEHCVARNI